MQLKGNFGLISIKEKTNVIISAKMFVVFCFLLEVDLNKLEAFLYYYIS